MLFSPMFWVGGVVELREVLPFFEVLRVGVSIG